MGTLFPAMQSTLAPDLGMVSCGGRVHDLPEHTFKKKKQELKNNPLA